jgi:hypothetical protein
VAPGPDGVIDWSSFDVTSAGDDPFGQLPAPEPRLVIPSRVRYPGLPWSRFWRFEEGDTSLPNVQIDPPELIKLVVLDFAIKAGVDWFDLALSQPVGTLAQIQSLLVKDVFGFYTVVDRADPAGTPAGLTRWTLYSLADNARRVAGLTVLPPSPGRMTAVAPPVEHVRFARDDNAALAWGIEAVTESAIGEPRRGSERDAAVNASLPPPAPSADTISPLRYLLENRVPIQWIPFVPVQTDTTTGTTELQRGVVAVPTPTGGVGLAFATGKILNPQSVGADQPYLLPDEEVPRAGVRVERFVTRARWIDGSAHLWVQRSRRTGSGETQSGLAFDLALPVRR